MRLVIFKILIFYAKKVVLWILWIPIKWTPWLLHPYYYYLLVCAQNCLEEYLEFNLVTSFTLRGSWNTAYTTICRFTAMEEGSKMPWNVSELVVQCLFAFTYRLGHVLEIMLIRHSCLTALYSSIPSSHTFLTSIWTEYNSPSKWKIMTKTLRMPERQIVVHWYFFFCCVRFAKGTLQRASLYWFGGAKVPPYLYVYQFYIICRRIVEFPGHFQESPNDRNRDPRAMADVNWSNQSWSMNETCYLHFIYLRNNTKCLYRIMTSDIK